MTCPSCGAAQEADVDVCFSCGRLITALTQGSILASRYEILTLLGKGGMGVVYKAQDRLLEEPVAIKVLRGELMNTPELARRFRSEIKLARKVTHTNVCRIHEYGEDGPLSYISMALIEGTDLRKLLRQQPEGLPIAEAFEASIQSADGLQAIHAVGIIHRDLKTPNIVRDDLGIVRLMDFGIAKEADRNAGLTATGEVMGTPEYMSPEQCRGDKLDFRSDIYSLGIVVYEVFTGRVPFHGETVMSTLLKQLQEPPPLDGPAAARLPPSVVPVLRRALAKQPSDRYGSAAELAEALRSARLGMGGPAAAIAPGRPAAAAQPEPPTAALSSAPVPAPVPAAEPSGSGAERRRDSRLGISVDLVVARLKPDGSFERDERTLADNIGRRGARVLTADDGAAVNDVLRIREHGGDFETRAAVRHVSVGTDGIRRLGVEFLDRQAPDRLVPFVEPKPRPRRTGTRGTRKTPHTPVLPAVAPRSDERRRDTRLGISFDLILRRTGPTGMMLEEERTVADNVGRQGVRVMTTMSSLSPGDVVSVEEVGGPFRTRAVVRNQHVGTDRIRRVGLEFLDRQAPGHLVPSEDRPSRAMPGPTSGTAAVRAETRTSHATATATPPGTPVSGSAASAGLTAAEVYAVLERARARSHFEVLGVAATASEAEVREAGQRLTRRFHPDAPVAPDAAHLKREIEVVFIRVAEAHEVLRDPGRRARHERMLGLTPGAPVPARPDAPPAEAEVRTTPSGVPAASASDPDSDVRLAAHMIKEARALLAQERNWDAMRMLEEALALAPGTKVNQSLRVLLAQATGRNPKWQKRAEEILLSVIQENANTPDAHLQLGVLYKRAGLKARAAAQFRTVLQLRPADPLAEAELAGLN
ncbi:MAG: protein kinase [Vicinamibacteria bacterium]